MGMAIKTVTKAALGDFDIVLKLEGEKPLQGPHAVGAHKRRPGGA